MQQLPEPLAPLAAFRQFLLYRTEPHPDKPGKTIKRTVNPYTGYDCGILDTTAWTDAATACATATAWGPPYGVAFVFTPADPFFFIDIDNCAEGAGWSATAMQVAAMFPGAAVEVSQSGRGLHIFGRGTVGEHRKRNDRLGLEFYTEARFVALTGLNAMGSAATEHSQALQGFVAQYMAPDGSSGPATWTTEPCEGWMGPLDDDVLINMAMRSQSAAAAFGDRASFADLWHADIERLAKAYPSTTGGSYDASGADAALAQHLAFWTGKNCERIQALMKRSKLARDKWEREDYLPVTIANAVARQKDVLALMPPEPPPVPVSDEATAPRMQPFSGNNYVAIEGQAELFKGCVYVLDQHRVLIPGGRLIKPDQFKIVYGGYSFMMDARNEKTSKDAWECFTQSQALRAPRADTSCFKPQHPAGMILADAGRLSVNTYWPVDVPRKAGDATPFLAHLAKVLPDPRDREILLSYMCACVQHMGVKFQWAPFLQGVEGNGKTLFTRCVAEAVGRRYVHWPKANKLTNNFNAWMVGKIFIGVEDIFTEDGRNDIWEQLKPMITAGDGLEIEAKGVDQISADLVCNFLINSNHKDGIRKTRNDRRIAPLYCGQQYAADLERDGMGGDYFPRLYEWLRADGYAIVSELLHTRPIPDEFNPATACQRTPITSSTESAIEAGLGSVEQEVNEMIETQAPGFAGGWVSSVALDHLLERRHMERRIPRNKRPELLRALGYLAHPGLPNGRTPGIVKPDMARVRLYIKQPHAAAHLTDGAAVALAYTEAQERAAKAAMGGV